ncbi:hypothetical protein ACVIW0_002061 [Bradyrhizobium sp. USDA 4454]
MMPPALAFNLRIGQRGLSYQDVIHIIARQKYPTREDCALVQIIPNSRGSHSEISGT